MCSKRRLRPADQGVAAAGVGSPAVTNDGGRISVQGTGRIALRPDLDRLRLSCLNEHVRAAAAFDACSSETAAVIAALAESGIGSNDLSTSCIVLSRRHDSDRYLALNSLVVTVRPPERAGGVLAVAVDAGGDALTIDNVAFDVADDAEARSQARQEAVQDARRTAEELAAASGVRLGRLISLEEAGGQRVTGQPRPSRRMSASAAPAPVEVGEQQVIVSVTASYEIAQDT